MVHVSHTTVKRVTTITSYNMVPGILITKQKASTPFTN
jgi:hypothetical protein